ncbi:MAG: NADP-specific glutamate dehydrogenase [Oligoflexales bacterium]|nr:NADP-specific glutamate dehydrogenase [Oligoflexales bacterium]
MHTYAEKVLNHLKNKYPWEKEFIQSVVEVFKSISLAIEKNPSYYSNNKILERITEPERTISFRVPWRDDRGNIQINTGHRVEFNSAIGAYKGGLRFHPSVSLSILKFLGFEQTFKNALTGLPMGGGKGGSDFDPRGKSDNEIMSFCQSFMLELYKYVGENIDIPAGDIGVGTREIGYMFGQYKRITGKYDGVLTGKGITWGGIPLRPEATGYGLVYFTQEMLKTIGRNVGGSTVAVSGFGNVSWGAVKKVNELGGKVVTLSGPDGFIYDQDGVKDEKIEFMRKMRIGGRDQVREYADKFKVNYIPGKKPWGVKCDIALPCATENEVDYEDVKALIDNGTICIAEGANLPLTLDAMTHVIQNGSILYAPGKASNAGGVACSGLEITQNATKSPWNREKVDEELRRIMKNIHDSCLEVCNEFGLKRNYAASSSILGFRKVSEAMIDQGVV